MGCQLACSVRVVVDSMPNIDAKQGIFLFSYMLLAALQNPVTCLLWPSEAGIIFGTLDGKVSKHHVLTSGQTIQLFFSLLY